MHPLEIRVRKTIREYGMLSPGEHVLVAVSGGADSTALLLCLHRISADFSLSLTVAHLNHRIRGPEGDADEDFVRRMCGDLNLPFISETIEVKKQAAEAKQNLEELARQMRYDFLRRTARQVKAEKIAVGHNLNDQAETALFRFIRGSGIEGLSAIHPVVDGLVIRPLLACSRDSILEYLKQRGASFREDSTNKDIRHARNRIRHELVPYLENAFNPRLVPTLAREALLARETWSFIESQSMQALQSLHSRLDEGISLRVKGLLELHPALQKQVLREALRSCMGSLHGINSIHIQSILSLCQVGHSGDQVRIPHGSIAVREFDSLLLLRCTPLSNPAFAYELDVPGQRYVAEAEATFKAMIGTAPDVKTMKAKCSAQAFLDASVLPPLLTIRSRLPGDRYGGTGHRKVKKMLISRRIPLAQRLVLPIVAVSGDVIWIPGFRPARGYEARPESQSCIRIEISRDSD